MINIKINKSPHTNDTTISHKDNIQTKDIPNPIIKRYVIKIVKLLLCFT